MHADIFANNWALIIAVVPATIALALVTPYLLARTASGQLRKMLAGYRQAQRQLVRAQKNSKQATARARKLASKAGKTRPSLLKKATEAAEDAAALEKIAADKVQVTANHVRKVIHEEFPPTKQQRLRQKYLPQDDADGRPYTF